MNSKFNEALELVDSLSLEEQEQLIEIEKKRIIEKKRKVLSQNIKEAQTDIEKGNYITGNVKDVMKAIDDEVKSDKKI
ncbi:MAG: hypothetical protein ABI840_01715 [bacterium]